MYLLKLTIQKTAIVRRRARDELVVEQRNELLGKQRDGSAAADDTAELPIELD